METGLVCCQKNVLVQVSAKWNCREMRAINGKFLKVKSRAAKSEKHHRREESKL
jgi:hypothetical protein